MSSFFTPTLAIFGLGLGFSVSWTVADFSATAPPRSLNLEFLQYNNDGTVTQRLSGDITADWTASILREVDGVIEVLCDGQGDGQGIYEGLTTTYTTATWVGDDCPPLQPGDIGRAGWTYINEAGTVVTITGRFLVGTAN